MEQGETTELTALLDRGSFLSRNSNHDHEDMVEEGLISRAERAILVDLGPAYAIVDQQRTIVHSGGPIDQFSSLKTGAPSLDIVSFVHDGLKMEVRALLQRALSENTDVIQHGVRMETDDGYSRIRLVCRPLSDAGKSIPGHFIILFYDLGPDVYFGPERGRGGSTDDRVTTLEERFYGTKEYSQLSADQPEPAKEELHFAIEEPISLNEDIRNASQELATSEEELKEVNTELAAINEELTRKIEELNYLSGFFEALLDSTQIPILFLDRELRIRRFTPFITEVFEVLDSDIGQSVTAITPLVNVVDLAADARNVLASLTPIERTVAPHNGERTLAMKILPYKTVDQVVDGVVVTFVDVTRMKEEQGVAETWAAQQGFVASIGIDSVRGTNMDEVLSHIPDKLARLLNVDFISVLRYRPESCDFVLVAKHGFINATGTVVPGGLSSEGGFVIQSGTPVIVENLGTEARFHRPTFLSDAGVVSGMSASIGDPQSPWGVLGVYTRMPRAFTANDVKFLQAVANIVAAIIQRDSWKGHQELLLDELQHRVKNSLATVQAIASLTFQKDELGPEDVERFYARLQALATAHEQRFENEGSYIDFGDLVRRQIEPYDVEGNLVSISGPQGIRLGPSIFIDTTMIIHELVTNAVKYGALSIEGGQLEIEWRFEMRAESEFLVLEWSESNGPPIDTKAEKPRGVGTKLIEAISNSSNFAVERDFRPEGFYCRFDVKLEGRQAS